MSTLSVDILGEVNTAMRKVFGCSAYMGESAASCKIRIILILSYSDRMLFNSYYE